MRLIDADMLKHRQLPDKGEPDESESKRWNYFYGYVNAIKAVCDMVDAEITIDAIPMEWMIEQRDKEPRGTHIWWMYQAIIGKWQNQHAEQE